MIRVLVDGMILRVDLKKSEKSGNTYGKVTVGWLDEEAGDAGKYTCTVDAETAATLQKGMPVTLVASGREKDFKIDTGFFAVAADAGGRRGRAAA